jgi:hypothetical protein
VQLFEDLAALNAGSDEARNGFLATALAIVRDRLSFVQLHISKPVDKDEEESNDQAALRKAMAAAVHPGHAVVLLDACISEALHAIDRALHHRAYGLLKGREREGLEMALQLLQNLRALDPALSDAILTRQVREWLSILIKLESDHELDIIHYQPFSTLRTPHYVIKLRVELCLLEWTKATSVLNVSFGSFMRTAVVGPMSWPSHPAQAFPSGLSSLLLVLSNLR